MKTIATAGLVLITAFMPLPVKAGTIAPALFGRTYCELMQMGADAQGAMTAAIRQSWVEGEDWTRVEFRGKVIPGDAMLGIMAATKICPEYMQ